jgi:polyisoprenyl-teichoic acid--peptidoglycan teichoic acid transferase
VVVSNQTVPNDKERSDESPSTGTVTALSGVAPDAESREQPAQTSEAKTLPKPRSWWVKRFALGATALISSIGAASLVLISPLPFGRIGHFQPNPWSIFGQNLQYPITRPINILLMGIDEVPGTQRLAGRSDTMLVVRIDPQAESASILSIPRDTQVQIPQVGLAKVNEANADGGPALARDVVSQTLGQLPLDRYVRVSTEAFREIVNELGGVDVFVPKPMKYTDETQKLYIDLKPGLQRLNGKQAEDFVRFRHDDLGDIGRVQRQQLVLRSLRARVTDPTVIARIPGMIRVFQNYIDTNLSLDEMLALAQLGLKLDQKQIRMVMLPGRFGSAEDQAESYWLMNTQGRDRVLKEYFSHSVMPEDVAHAAVDTTASVQSLNIAVQNASGADGMGAQVANQLKAQGFSNVYVVEDWPEPLTNSQIIVQQGDLKGAAIMQQRLGVGSVETSSTGDIESDLTLRIGKDWVKPTNPEAAQFQ